MWFEGKRSAIVFDSVFSERAPLAVSDGEGGAYVLASMDIPSTEKISGVVALVSRRLDAGGKLVWERRTHPAIGASVGKDLQPDAMLLLPSAAVKPAAAPGR